MPDTFQVPPRSRVIVVASQGSVIIDPSELGDDEIIQVDGEEEPV